MSDGTAASARLLRRVAEIVTLAVYRDIEVHWVEPPIEAGPEVTVANHFGGVSDAIVLVACLPRTPGIIARDLIWKVPVVGRLMTWIGAIPVHQPEDRGSPTSNDDMFAACYRALDADRNLLIFPEGLTRDEPSIGRVKTGAARIALGARGAGVRGIAITPVGIHYEDKAALRHRVAVEVGRAIDLDEIVAESDAPVDSGPVDRSRVSSLTAEIDHRLRRAAPDFEDWREHLALSRASEIALRPALESPSNPVPYGLQTRLANALADRPPERRRAIREAAELYVEHLDVQRLSDEDVAGFDDRPSLGARIALQTVLGLLLLPFAIAGAVVHLPAYLVVLGVGRLRFAPAMHATVKPLSAVGAFGLTWAVIGWWVGSTWGLTAASAVVLLFPIYLAAAILLVDRVLTIALLVRDGRRSRGVGSRAATLRAERAAVIEAVWAP